MKKLRVIAKDGSILGVFRAQSDLDAWQQCCKGTLSPKELKDAGPIKSIEPGITFQEVKDSDFKPTHVITKNGRDVQVQRGEALGFPNLELFYAKDEWLDQTPPQWDRVDGKKLRYKGKEQAFAAIKEIGS
jgi:hypothetical protein